MSRRRRVALAVAGVLGVLAAAGAWFVPYHPVVVAGAAPVAPPYPAPAPTPGLRLHVFNTGYNRMSSLLVGSERPWRPAPAFVIEHPREGLIVFDTGLSPEVAQRGEAALPLLMRTLFESRGRPERTLDRQMRDAGLDPTAVRWVVLSHLHEDHTGTVGAFPHATVLCGTEHEGFRRVAFVPGGPAPFDAHLDLFGDGSVVLLRGGGHSHEDVMALVALPGGPALLTGDAVVHRAWLAADDVQRIAVDPQRAADVRNQVRAFMAATPALALFPGHDLAGTPVGREAIALHHPEWFGPESWPISE